MLQEELSRHEGRSGDASPPTAQRLTDLCPGSCGLVVEVEAAGDDTERLKVMGVCAGRKVRLVRHGDPMILCVWGTRVGVSRRLAQQVHVRPCVPPGCEGFN
jgi:Fe2+ transport system protein FeoA